MRVLRIWMVCIAWLGAVNAVQAEEKAGGCWVCPQSLATSVYMVEGQTALGSTANRNFISNAGFVITRDGVVVIDALGSAALAQALVDEIRRITPLPITHVLVTHFHADHIYGLQVFQSMGARIVAHEGGKHYLYSDTAQARLAASRVELSPWVDEATQLVFASQWLNGSVQWQLGGVDFHVLHFGPAHTPEDLVVYLPEQRVLFAGDLVFRQRIPFVGQADSRRWQQALTELSGLKVDVVVPGHGPSSRQFLQEIETTRAYLHFVRTQMMQAIEQGRSFEEAYRSVDWSAFAGLPLFGVANRMNAFNIYLQLEEELLK